MAYISFQIPATQTFVIKQVTNALSKKIDGQINIGKLHYVFFSKAIIKDFSIVSEGDTLICCKKISVGIDSKELLHFNLNFNKVSIEGGEFHLKTVNEEKLTNLHKIFKIDRERERKEGGGLPNLSIRKINVEDFRFRLTNPYKDNFKGDSIINFAALDIKEIEVRAKNLIIINNTLTTEVINICGKDKSGFELKELRGDLTVAPKETKITNLTLKDRYSTVIADYFSMQYNNAQDFADFTNRVVLGLGLNGSKFSFETISRFSPSLAKSNLNLLLTGEVKGAVCDLRSRGLQVESYSGKTKMNLDFSLLGLPDVNSTICRIEIEDCKTNGKEVAKIIAGITGRPEIETIKNFSPHVSYLFNGSLTGLVDDFVAYGVLDSDIGQVSVDMLLKNDKKQGGFILDGNLKSQEFNVGDAIEEPLFGELTMDGAFSAIIKRNRGGIRVEIDSAKVHKFEVNDYPYTNIQAVGVYDNTGFDGRIICHDPNLDFLFQGTFSNRGGHSGLYNFYANIPYANLNALNLDKRDSVSVVSMNIISNIDITELGDAIGKINIYNAEHQNSYGLHSIGNIEINSYSADSNYNAFVKAPFIDLEYTATASQSECIAKIKELLLYKNLPMAFEKQQSGERGNYKLDFNIYNSNAICQVIKPGLYIQDSTKGQILIDCNDQLSLSLRSGRLAIGENYLKEVSLEANNRDSLLSAILNCGTIKLSGMSIDSTKIELLGRDNILDALIRIGEREAENSALVGTTLNFIKDTILATVSDSSYFNFKGNKWEVKPAKITYASSSCNIENGGIYNREQSLDFIGENDSLSFKLNNFDISVINLIVNKPFNFRGYFSGNCGFSIKKGKRNLFLDMNGDSVYIYGTPVGKVRLLSKWYAPEQRLNLLVSSRRESQTQLMATGYYRPKDEHLELNLSLEELSLSYFEPFFSSILSKTWGSFSGDLKLEGNGNELKLTGEQCRFNNFSFIVNYTGVPYIIDGPVTITEDKITLNRVSLRDNYNGRGVVTGHVKHNYFRDLSLDTKIEFVNMESLNLEETDNEIFYGQAFTTGSVRINGTPQKIALDVDISPNQRSEIHIPLSSATTASATNLLTFKEPVREVVIDPYDTLHYNRVKRNNKTDLLVNLRSEMNSNANMFIEINKETGDIIRANGEGHVSLTVNPSNKLFNIYGDYMINDGSYRFVLPGFSFASRDFNIQPGGNITFNGGIDNTTLNLTAIYTTKAAINTLIADTSSVSTRRNVNCLISMSGHLMNPTLDFDIEIPDLDPTTKVRVESALNSAGKIQRQFAALLISGGFLPDEQSGITNNSTILYSNVSEMISNQINNIFNQLGIPLDLGLNYQPNERGNDIFDVAVSTQLFNNRLIINGNIGNDPYSASNNREVIGNVDVEVKLDREGKLRLSLFSHAADKYSNYLDDSQRSGLGLSYRREFNTFKDIFRKKSPEEKAFKKRMKEYRKAQKRAERAKE